jgi:hypothetical protein
MFLRPIHLADTVLDPARWHGVSVDSDLLPGGALDLAEAGG